MDIDIHHYIVVFIKVTNHATFSSRSHLGNISDKEEELIQQISTGAADTLSNGKLNALSTAIKLGF